MSDIFVSYASHDRARVRHLARFLGDNGHTVWWDRELIIGGDFEKEIDRQLKNSDIIIVCWSARSAASHWVKSEANEGMRSERLVPVTLDRTPAPRPFDQLTTLDLSRWDDEAGQRLLTAIGNMPETPAMSAFQKARQRTHILVGAATACIVLVVAGLWAPVTARLTQAPANAVTAYEKPRISEAATRHILRRLNDTGRQTGDAAFALIQTGDVHDAIRLLEAKYNEMEPDTPKEEEAALLHQIGALAFDYDPSKAHGVYQSLVLLAPDDPLALEQSGHLFRDKGDVQRAEELFKRALNGLDGLSDARRLDFEIPLNHLRLHTGQFQSAVDTSEQLIARAEALEDDSRVKTALRHGATTHSMLGLIEGEPAYFSKALDLINQSIELPERSGSEAELTGALITKGFILGGLGDNERAIESYEKALNHAQQLEMPINTGLAISNLAHTRARLKQYDAAEALYRQALQHNTQYDLPHLQSGLWLGLARLAKDRGSSADIICQHLSKAKAAISNDFNPTNRASVEKFDCS